MIVKTHMTFNSIAILSIKYFTTVFDSFSFSQFLIFYCASIIGSIFPDIDEKNSYISRKIPIISIITSSLLKHKTYTHYLFLPVGIFVFSFYFIEDLGIKISLMGFAVGILLHDMGDMFTMNGIRGFLYPFFPNTNIVLLPCFLRFTTNGMVEYIVLACFSVINFALIFLVGTAFYEV